MTTETEILQYLHYHPLSKRLEIGHAVTTEISERTLKRVIADCVEKGISRWSVKDRLPNTNLLLKLM